MEVAGIKDLQSLLSLSWATVIIPAIGATSFSPLLSRASSLTAHCSVGGYSLEAPTVYFFEAILVRPDLCWTCLRGRERLHAAVTQSGEETQVPGSSGIGY